MINKTAICALSCCVGAAALVLTSGMYTRDFWEDLAFAKRPTLQVSGALARDVARQNPGVRVDFELVSCVNKQVLRREILPLKSEAPQSTNQATNQGIGARRMGGKTASVSFERVHWLSEVRWRVAPGCYQPRARVVDTAGRGLTGCEISRGPSTFLEPNQAQEFLLVLDCDERAGLNRRQKNHWQGAMSTARAPKNAENLENLHNFDHLRPKTPGIRVAGKLNRAPRLRPLQILHPEHDARTLNGQTRDGQTRDGQTLNSQIFDGEIFDDQTSDELANHEPAERSPDGEENISKNHCLPTKICATADDLDAQPMRMSWRATDPNGADISLLPAGNLLEKSSQKSTYRECKMVPGTVESARIEVSVRDLVFEGRPAPGASRLTSVEDAWLADFGLVARSRDEISIEIAQTCQRAVCPDDPGERVQQIQYWITRDGELLAPTTDLSALQPGDLLDAQVDIAPGCAKTLVTLAAYPINETEAETHGRTPGVRGDGAVSIFARRYGAGTHTLWNMVPEGAFEVELTVGEEMHVIDSIKWPPDTDTQ